MPGKIDNAQSVGKQTSKEGKLAVTVDIADNGE